MSTPPSAEGLRVLAHELRSPVAALAAIAEAYGAADHERRARLVELAAAAGASIELLLSDARPGAVRVGVVDVAALARDAVDAAALRGAVELATPTGPLPVEGDRVRLRQALDNLIGNALGHAPPGTAVSVVVAHRGGSVVVSVTDLGEGVAAEDVERVFEPGVRLTDARPGQGLGLAVTREIARAHRGDVELDSAPGRGATFTLVLPADAAG
jgi:two-component system OmpR family sensor kinase